RDTITKILEVATRSPSGMNTQPWEFTVLGGKVLDDLRQALRAQVNAGVPTNSDFPRVVFTGVYRKRQIEVGVALYGLLGIAREDKEKRLQWEMQIFGAFNAPNLIIVSIDEALKSSYQSLFSLGAVMQTIALTALEFGLGTCLLAATTEYPDVVRQVTGIPASKKLACSVAIGYPDLDAPANKLQTTREPVDNVTTWLGV
ncbi:MAG: nitroreductase, partial [Dehalococcoidia bacterium]|nr:nitroreductase [Dehalococcoidia bacterium]